MPLAKWKKISSEVKFKNNWWSYVIDKYLLPSGKEGEYHYVHTAGSAFIVPINQEGDIIMVKQYRYLDDRESLEFPGGGIKENEEPKNIALKELIEETGFEGDVIKMGFFNPYKGVTDEMCHVFLARNLKPSSLHQKDESEEFEIKTFSKRKIEEMIYTNEIYDGMTLAVWALVREKL